MNGRYHVSFEDIRALAYPVFRHRILTNFHAESERISKTRVVQELLAAVPEPRSRMQDAIPMSSAEPPRAETASRFLAPEVLAILRNIELVDRPVRAGFLSG